MVKYLRFISIPTGCLSGFRITPRRPVLLQGIHGAADASATPVENVRIDHGGLGILVPEEFLNGANIVPCLQQMGRPAQVRDKFRNAGTYGRSSAW